MLVIFKTLEEILLKPAVTSCIRMKAQTLVDSLSELMVDASLGTIQCLEEIVSYYVITLSWLISPYDHQLKKHIYAAY